MFRCDPGAVQDRDESSLQIRTFPANRTEQALCKSPGSVRYVVLRRSCITDPQLADFRVCTDRAIPCVDRLGGVDTSYGFDHSCVFSLTVLQQHQPRAATDHQWFPSLPGNFVIHKVSALEFKSRCCCHTASPLGYLF